MAEFVCNACDGVFPDVLTDGTRYFHACPPERFVRVKRAGADLVVALADVQPGDLFRVRRAGVEIDVAAPALQEGDERVGDEPRVRPDRGGYRT